MDAGRLDVENVIFGGGIAGLWLLDDLVQSGRSALLLEAGALGSGQTVASQGIIHGGLKYTLQGALTRSASQIREMPEIWRQSLAGTRTPNLSQTPLRSSHCYLWRTESLKSRLGMIGARIGLRVAPSTIEQEERPEVLRNCPGTVAQLEEQVLSPAGMIADLFAQHQSRILKIDFPDGVQFNLTPSSRVKEIRLKQDDQELTLLPRNIIFSAGKGNIALREQVGLSTYVGQLRPLHMVMVKGELPALNGHCVDGAKTRLTISSDQDSSGRTIWQLGGQVAEVGVKMDSEQLVQHAAAELLDCIPGLDLKGTEWSTYRVDRAEPATTEGTRPDSSYYLQGQNIWTAWPTKLALAPQLSEKLRAELPPSNHTFEEQDPVLVNWPRPQVALPLWERAEKWVPYQPPAAAASKAA